MHYIDKVFSPRQDKTGGCLFASTAAERSYATHNNFFLHGEVLKFFFVVVVVVLPLPLRKGDTGNNTCSWLPALAPHSASLQ